MLRLVTPDLRLASIHDLSPERVRALGLDGLLLDVDGTLKDYYVRELPDASIVWIGELLSAGIRLCVLSNGRSRRIGPLASAVGLPFVSGALKPLPIGCNRALRALGLPAGRVGVVGDQIFADVLAGRLAGLKTILVAPTTRQEPWFTRIKRPLERAVLHWVSGGPTPSSTESPIATSHP